MPYSMAQILHEALEIVDGVAQESFWIDVDDFGTLGLFIDGTKAGTAGDLTVKVQASPQSAAILNANDAGEVVIDYDRMLSGGNVVASQVFSATSGKFLSFSADALRSIRVVATAATADAVNKWTLTIWLTGRAG